MTRILLTLVTLAIAAPAGAQSQSTAPGRGEMHLGSFTFRPRLEITEMGFDSNVFNDPVSPQEDFTATITPRLGADFDVSWGRLRSSTYVDFVYFHEFDQERSLNRGVDGRLEFFADRFRPYIGGSAVNTHARVNAEVDARAGRQEWRADVGALFAITPRTMIVVGASRGALTFADDELFRGVELAETLNSDMHRYEAGMRFELTPLTTFQIVASSQWDRFDSAEERDARTIRVTPSFEFAPSALISGRLSFGYTNFEPEDPAVASFRGFTLLANLTWVGPTTKLEGTYERDVKYSYELLQPYYVTNGGRLTATQIIAGPFDVQGTVGRQNLAYRNFEPITGTPEGRTDTIVTWGGGIGFRLGDTARLGLNFDQTERDSDLPGRRYDRQRIFGTVTYGF
jgi:hypothetical protein